MIKLFLKRVYAGIVISLIIIACSKSSSGDNPSPTNPCANVNINLTATVTDATACQNNGSINATATGGSGFTYSINGTSFQASGSFASVAPGSVTVTAKDANGCTKTTTVTVGSAGVAGAKFLAVKALIQANCQSCHNNTIANGGMNWAVDCNIVANSGRIKVRAVDEGTMPPTGPLSQSDKNKITDWINAGGKFID